MTDPRAHYAARLEREPDFLAHSLAKLRDARGQTDADLCAALG
jgi:hypothetical protein